MADNYDQYSKEELLRLLRERDRKPKFGLVWERNEIEHDKSLNDDFVALDFDPALSCGDAPFENLIIEGDNFDALRYLRMTHAGRVNCIYIDPPYNTGNRDFIYNDRFVDKEDVYRHSKWLEFMYRRLILAKDLLAEDGVILLSINDENRSRLELLMESVFPGMRLGSLVWRTKDTGNDLSQRFSHVHEHVLAYANAGFKFNGRATDRSKFRNPDNDPRGDWSPQPLTANKTLTERKNTYYPIQDPSTGYWYPCDPNRVWAYASKKDIRNRLSDNEAAIEAALKGLRSDTIEQLIEKKLIYFPSCKPSEVIQFASREELLAAIKIGKGPMLPKKKTQLLREDLPDLDFWVGKPIAVGRPSRKELWTAKPEEDRIAPLSSWIAGMNEDVDLLFENEDDEPVVLRSARGGVATEEVKDVFGSKIFQHPKPLSLMMSLISQASSPNDIILDFFAGSGTTAHAVLKLNSEENSNRCFILVSSTEATSDVPDKNLCREVCAERVRLVMRGYANNKGEAVKGLGGSFAYLRTKRIPVSRVFNDMQHEQVWQALQLIHGVPLTGYDQSVLVQLSGNEDGRLMYVPKLSEAILDEVVRLAHLSGRLVVYSWQPGQIKQRVDALNVAFEKIPEFLVSRFGGMAR